MRPTVCRGPSAVRLTGARGALDGQGLASATSLTIQQVSFTMITYKVTLSAASNLARGGEPPTHG